MKYIDTLKSIYQFCVMLLCMYSIRMLFKNCIILIDIVLNDIDIKGLY